MKSNRRVRFAEDIFRPSDRNTAQGIRNSQHSSQHATRTKASNAPRSNHGMHGGYGLHGPLHEQILLEWAGMGSQRWSLHKNVLAQIHIVVRSMAGWRCCTCFQSTIGVRVLSSEKICKNLETHAQSKTRFQRQGPADLQPFRNDEEYLRCRIRYRIRYHILYIVCDIVCIHDVVYDVQYTTSYTMSYTTSYVISFITTPESYSAGLAAPASRRRFRVSAPLRLDS
jgi:hypothetical protein